MEPAGTAPDARRFGKYTLVAKLATGGMAEIFLARLHGDGGFEKLVCIKRILPHLAKDPQFVAMFLDEARVAARISHPNVCQVFELGEWEGKYYIAMEYLEGVPLSVFRRKDFYAALPDPRLVAAFGVQACEGLHHAHQLKRADGELLGVVHRDISPQNLFATTDGIVKVLDFGIAKVQDASVRTSTGAVKGTYAYMAPEQLRNEGLDRRVDVWAMGAVLWETLAQRYLFKRETEFLTFEAITTLPIPNICEVRPDVPPLLGDTIMRALSRNRDDRFASARSLGEALAQAVAPLGGVASPATISDEVSRSFEATLAEQRMLLRIAREGGQFDLERPSPLVAHGTSLSTTPVSNMQRRVEEAQAEVAHYVAATQAIESLYEDEDMRSRPNRFDTDGSFTPAPSRRTAPPEAGAYDSAGEPESGITLSDPLPQRRSQSHEARSETEEPVPPPRRSTRMPHAAAPPVEPRRRSKLPWMIAIVVVAATSSAAVLLYMELKSMRRAAPASATPAGVADDSASASIVMPEIDAGVAVAPLAAETKVEDDQPVVVAPLQEAHADATKDDDKRERSDKRKRVDRDAKQTDESKKGERDARKADESRKVARDAKKADEAKKVDEAKKPDDKSDKVVKTDQDGNSASDKADKADAAGPGFITIDSTPVYAVIYIDGKKYGETPLVNIKLPPGKHSVRAVSPSGSTRNLTIHIESGKTAPVRRIEW
jgi:eukaryotic-like serine/threonine-protein kinase